MRILVTYQMWEQYLKMMQAVSDFSEVSSLYLESDTYPTEEQQFAVYKQVAERMAGKKVIIRT